MQGSVARTGRLRRYRFLYSTAWLTTHGCAILAHPISLRSLLVLLSVGCSGYPALRVQHHYLAFVTLAFKHAHLPRLPQRGMADQWHLRHHERAAAECPRLVDEPSAQSVLLPARAPGAHLGNDLAADPVAVGACLHGGARKSDPRALARRRYLPPLYVDGVCHRGGSSAALPARSMRRSFSSSIRRPSRSPCHSICCSWWSSAAQAISLGRFSVPSSPCCCLSGLRCCSGLLLDGLCGAGRCADGDSCPTGLLVCSTASSPPHDATRTSLTPPR